MVDYSLVIQAGGQSRRMGQDKALLPFGDGTLLEYILAQVQGLGDEQLIVSNKPEEYARFGLPVHADVIPGTGALGGLYSAIFHAQYQHVLLLACDMPFINRPLLEYMLGLAEAHDAVVPVLKESGFAEPFRAVYSKGCLPAIKAAIRRGDRKVISFFDQVNVYTVPAEVIHRYDPQERSFFNINTPEDLNQALIQAKY